MLLGSGVASSTEIAQLRAVVDQLGIDALATGQDNPPTPGKGLGRLAGARCHAETDLPMLGLGVTIRDGAD